MTQRTSIEWTDVTWNPIRGCSLAPGSEEGGCKHCYAMGIAARFSGPGQAFEGVAKMVHGKPHWTGKIRVVEDVLLEPLHWRKPRRVFVNSMSDLFHDGVSDATLDRIFAVMALTPHITYQVLTKRPERMREYIGRRELGNPTHPRVMNAALKISEHEVRGLRQYNDQEVIWRTEQWPLPNIWLGVSVENQATADARIPELLATPAAIRFVSLEPLLGAIDLTDIHWPDALWPRKSEQDVHASALVRHETVSQVFSGGDSSWGPSAMPGLDWVIVGGESGRGARPMHPYWAQSIRDQCVVADVPFFMKQLSGLHGRAIKDMALFPVDLRIQEFPHAD